MSASPAAVPQTPAPLRVLVVDDEPSIVDVVCMGLRHHGYEVTAAGTGTEALRQARDWRPHAIVLDVMLPDMEGFDVASAPGEPNAPSVPIVFLTARDAHRRTRCAVSPVGGDDYMTKPFSLEELVATDAGPSSVAPDSAAPEARAASVFEDLAARRGVCAR